MNKTKFLAILALPAMFVACTQEEVVTESANNVDLSSRKVIENVTLNFNTGIESRATLGDAAWNKYQLDPATDGVGAALVDQPISQDGSYMAQLTASNACGVENNYEVVEYISTNYKYYVSGEQWKTDALMVEGNYVFYAPYNAKHLTRTAISAAVPSIQNVKSGADDRNALKEFYESGNPVFAGYKFLPAVGQSAIIDVKMQHLFAYPLFTLVNKVDFRTPEQIAEEEDPVYKDIKIVKVEVKGGQPLAYKFNHDKIKDELHGNHVTLEDNEAWDATKHEDNVTTDLLDENGDGAKITVNMGAGITIPAEGKISFHLVLPAAAYEEGIEIVAYDEEGNTYTIDSKQVRTGLTLNPGYRYPAQEYDTDENNSTESVLKESKGSLLTYVLTEQNGRPSNIADNDDFIRYLKSLTVRYNTLKELERKGEGQELAEDEFVLNEDAEIIVNNELIDALIKYNYNRSEGGSVKFLSNVTIAQDVVVESAAVEDGYATLKIKSTSGAYNYAYTVIVPAQETGNITTAGTYVVSEGKINVTAEDKPVNVIVTGNVTYESGEGKITSLNVVKNGTLTLNDNIENLGKITINADATLNISKNVLVAKVLNNFGTINNSGVMYGEANHNEYLINVMSADAITKAATGYGEINNTVLGDVIAGATQTVTWTGNYKTTYSTGSKNYASKGITKVIMTNAELKQTTVAMLNEPFKGCNVSDIEFKNLTSMTIAEGGNFEGVTLWFSASDICTWTGSALNAPSFTNAKVAVATGSAVQVEYAKVTGVKVAPNALWKGSISAANSTGSVNVN